MNYAVERAAAREAQLGEPISAKPRGAAPFHVPPTHISENARRRSSENARNGAATTPLPCDSTPNRISWASLPRKCNLRP